MPLMKLAQILEKIKTPHEVIASPRAIAAVEIDDIATDSRLVKKNSIFFALRGEKNDGAEFVFQSVNQGAQAIVISKHSKFDFEIFFQQYPQITVIISDDNFLLLVEFLQIFYRPFPKNIYAVTGTNGKTSTVEFIRQILKFLNIKSASIGTLGINCDDIKKQDLINFNLTTPDIVALYKNLHILKNSAIDDVAIEVSSIGLDQGRIAGLEIGIAGFTNFTQDHLDYHLTMEKYFYAKLQLFTKYLQPMAYAVLNADVKEYHEIVQNCQKRQIKIIDYGFAAQKLKLIKIDQQKIFFEFNDKQYQFEMSASGDFQAFNLLCALGCVLSKHNLNEDDLMQLMKKFLELKSAMGRMQKIAQLQNNAQIFIDFAHSPDALENVLKQARSMLDNKKLSKEISPKLVVLFGCGGDRDRQKRPIMGKIASELADVVILSDDNPRSENPQLIRKEILSGCLQKNIIEINDRRLAIIEAIKILNDNDILILAGKGHEKYQIIGDKKIDFDEEQIVKNAIK